MRRSLLIMFVAVFGNWPVTAASQATSSAEKSAGGNVIRVGTARDIQTLRRASQIARDGDVIEIDAGDYRGDGAVWTQNNLVIRGTGARPRLFANDNVTEGKGIFVVRGGQVTIENVAFLDARVPDRNGAGVRLERGALKIVGCAFENNENGILTSNDSAIELEVVDSTFVNNGAGDGYSHHLYAGAIAKLTVTGSYFGPARKGHLLKSRAKATTVMYSRLTGEGGTSSYEMDIPNGGQFVAMGNLVQQGNETENHALISYGAEGYRWPENRVLIAFNTLVNDRARGGVFVVVRPGAAEANIANNVLVGRGEFEVSAPSKTKNNIQARADDFADVGKFDYRLRPGSKLVGVAGTAGTFESQNRPAREYRHPASSAEIVGVTALTPVSPGAFQRLAR